jgi:hypothetical protein
VASDAANLRALLRVLLGKANWAARAGRTLGCSKRHVYRLTGGQRRLTPRAVAILEAIASDRLKRREREIHRNLAMAHARAAEERSLFPWAPRYLAELRERIERRQQSWLSANADSSSRGERDSHSRDL